VSGNRQVWPWLRWLLAPRHRRDHRRQLPRRTARPKCCHRWNRRRRPWCPICGPLTTDLSSGSRPEPVRQSPPVIGSRRCASGWKGHRARSRGARQPSALNDGQRATVRTEVRNNRSGPPVPLGGPLYTFPREAGQRIMVCVVACRKGSQQAILQSRRREMKCADALAARIASPPVPVRRQKE
jgi:hypothetical protein